MDLSPSWLSWGSLGSTWLASPLYSCFGALKSPWTLLCLISHPVLWFPSFRIAVSYLSHFCLLSHLLSFWAYTFFFLSHHPSGLWGKKQRWTYLLTTALPPQNVSSLFSFSNTENGLRKSQFSCMTSYPQQRTHHMFRHCQEPSERQIFSGFVLSPKINLTAWFTIMFMKVFCKWNASLWNQWTEINEHSKEEADLYISSVVEHMRGGSAKHFSQWLCF